MATSTANDSRCATCGKAAGTFTCRGCAKDFCLRHTNEHRQELTKQMDEDVIPLHDQLRQNLDEQTKKPDRHPLMKRIDEWEQASTEKIQQAANDARKQLLDIINKHTDKMKETLQRLTQQLKKARDDDHFFETDLKEWIKKLDALKKDLITPQTINIRYDDNNTASFISKILINEIGDSSDECFEQAIGNIQITNNGTVITHNQTYCYAYVRGRCEYTTGEHRLRFMIENLSQNKWLFLGVISKSTPPQVTEATGITSYGFAGQNTVCCNGVGRSLNGYMSDFEINDTIELFINCNQRKLRLKNERTQSTHILDVDIAKCPFPWKLSVGFCHSPGERVRILL